MGFTDTDNAEQHNAELAWQKSGITPWTLEEALSLCKYVEAVAPKYGAHVALTGGVLYKGAPRKDLDILFYRIRQVEKIDIVGLFASLHTIGIVRVTTTDQWCIKATCANGSRKIDCFFPELPTGDEKSSK